MSVSYPKVGQIINIDTYSMKNELRLIIGFQGLNVITYPLFLSEMVLYLAYGEEFINQHINIILSKVIDPKYVLVHPIYYKDKAMNFKKVKSVQLCNDKTYVEEEVISKWYMKNKLINKDMPDITDLSIEKEITEELNKTLSCTLEDKTLKKLGIYKLSGRNCFVYLGYHKGLDSYVYMHVRKRYLETDYDFYNGKKIKVVNQLGHPLLEAEQIGTVLKTEGLCNYLKERGFAI